MLGSELLAGRTRAETGRPAVIRFSGKSILVDIEGTTSSIAFVFDVLFPYARGELPGFLQAFWQDPEVVGAREQLARDAGAESFRAWLPAGDAQALEQLAAEVLRLMDADAKTTGLKQLQGLIWRQGYGAGVLVSHVYADVPPALCAWKQAGLRLSVYSSGSAAAQQLFFAHTEHGDLSGLFEKHYDTTIGPKRDPKSYARIADDRSLPPAELLFLSDVPAELDAARSAGLQTALVVRPGNPKLSDQPSHECIADFTEIKIVPSER